MNTKLRTLKTLLVIQVIGLIIYTVITIQTDGIDFFARFQEFATSLTWMGQFTLDFQCYLLLSALWISWRNKFSTHSIFLAIVAMILGIIVFAPYLLYLINKEKGNMKAILIGKRE